MGESLGKLFSFRNITICVAGAALGFALAFAISFWNSDKSAEFFGAFAAAFIAAAALIFGAVTQDHLERKREDDLRQQKLIANALDLCFWLDHAGQELDVILRVLREAREELLADDKTNLEMPLNQFREAVTSHFFGDILQHAKSASQLPPALASIVTRDLYRAYTTSDRIFILRGASNTFRPSVDNLSSYIMLVESLRGKFRRSTVLVEEHLISTGAVKPGQMFHEN